MDHYFRHGDRRLAPAARRAVAADRRPLRRLADDGRLDLVARVVPALRGRAHPARHRARRADGRARPRRLLPGDGRHPADPEGDERRARGGPRRDRVAGRRAGRDAQLAQARQGRARRPQGLRPPGDPLRQVPIVPVATVGGHDTVFVLSEGRFIATWTGLGKSCAARRCRSSPASRSRSPSRSCRCTCRCRRRSAPSCSSRSSVDTDPTRADDEQYVDQIYREVETAIQAGMDRLAKRRSFPIFG